MHVRRWLCWAWLVTTLPGCVIGTWPTPEDDPNDIPRGGEPVGPESCDEIDNDGDGSIDEGCACKSVARGCIGVGDGTCALGVQYCEDRRWRECGDLGPPYAPRKERAVLITSITPETWERGSLTKVVIAVEPTASCDAIAVPQVEVEIVTALPALHMRVLALDDGAGADVEAADGVYTASLVLPFGPGVPAQSVQVLARVYLDSEETTHLVTVPLEVPHDG